MYAVFETGGQQFKVKVGDALKIDRIEGEVGQDLNFDKVLLLKTEEGCVLGSPYLAGVRVRTKILAQDRHRKVLVFKYKRRKGYQKLRGHRQHFTKVRITEIGEQGKTQDTAAPSDNTA